jgi:acyl-CoA thioesterase-2
MAFDVPDFTTLLRLEPHGTDAYLGISPVYPWGERVYGGQVAAQALRAAIHTVEETYRVHSLHSYFIRPGDVHEPIRYEVDRIRNGRSFCTRRVVARQSGGAILNLSASFQIIEEQADVQSVAMPEVTGPDELEPADWGELIERRSVDSPESRTPGRTRIWLRVKPPAEPVADPTTPAHVLDVCALTFASDDMPTEAAVSGHPRVPSSEEGWAAFVGASLDHSLWFHRPAPADEWLLHDLWGDTMEGGRGLAMGRIYRADGSLVASLAQQVLFREREFPG